MCSKIIIFVFVHFIIECSQSQRSEQFFRKDYKYYETSQSFYKLHTAGRTWQEAKRICASENAKLLVIEDQQEADVVLTYLKEKGETLSVYIGISDLVAEGVFETIDGRSILDVYHKWRPHQPDNSKDEEDCVEMFSDLQYNDRRCERPLRFVCKKTLDSLRWNEECNMSFLDYTYNATLGRCYKFHSNPKNWTDAHALCAAEQSYLAVINSRDEANYLVELAAKSAIPQAGDYDKINILLGFHDQFDEGWTTVKGIAGVLVAQPRQYLADDGPTQPVGAQIHDYQPALRALARDAGRAGQDEGGGAPGARQGAVLQLSLGLD